MPKAWGEVTSWMRWVPMRSWVWPLASLRTEWASQTFSKSDLGWADMIVEIVGRTE